MSKENNLSVTQINHLRRMATYASCSVATILIATKLVAYLMTDSIAMMSSLIDSSVDLLGSLVTMYAVSSAIQPPDREHRYGHGKAEPLGALTQAGFIFGSSLLLCSQALERLVVPTEIKNSNVGYAVMIASIVLTFALIQFQRHVIRKSNSMAISADHLHYASDLMINIAVIASIFLQNWLGVSWIDPLFGLGIGATLLYSAWKIGKDALRILMDQELPDEDREKIKATTLAVPGVIGIHDLRTRSDSERVFIELHIEISPETQLKKAHDVAENAMDAINHIYPKSDIIVHMDPAGVLEPRLDNLIEKETA